MTVNGDYTVTTAGAVVQDLRINGDLVIKAPNVTVRRVDVVNGSIDNLPGSTCANGLVVMDSNIRTGRDLSNSGSPAIGVGGYVADNVLITDSTEGFRVGGRSYGCGAVTITNSYAHIESPIGCGDWHGDGIQGYDGAAVTVKNTVLWLDESSGCGGTAPFFYPAGQGNTSATIDGLIVRDGGYPFRMTMPGSVKNLNIVTGWGYGPIEVNCGLLTSWTAQIVTLDSAGQPVKVADQPCT
ncbi:hypothetical protein [Nocardioides dilutus]